MKKATQILVLALASLAGSQSHAADSSLGLETTSTPSFGSSLTQVLEAVGNRPELASFALVSAVVIAGIAHIRSVHNKSA